MNMKREEHPHFLFPPGLVLAVGRKLVLACQGADRTWEPGAGKACGAQARKSSRLYWFSCGLAARGPWERQVRERCLGSV